MSYSGANYQCKEGSRYVEITVFQVWGVECLMCTKIVFNQNLAMFQQSCQEDSIVPDLRVVQKFVFAAKFVPPTVNRSSCWRNAVAVGSQVGGNWWGANGCGGKLCRSW